MICLPPEEGVGSGSGLELFRSKKRGRGLLQLMGMRDACERGLPPSSDRQGHAGCSLDAGQAARELGDNTIASPAFGTLCLHVLVCTGPGEGVGRASRCGMSSSGAVHDAPFAVSIILYKRGSGCLRGILSLYRSGSSATPPVPPPKHY